MKMNTTVHEDIVVETYRGMTILRSTDSKPSRRMLYLNSYGMATAWRKYRDGFHPGQHLWGCLELTRIGYEIAMPEEPTQRGFFFNYRRQDLRHLGFVRNWLGGDGIIYSGHTILFWAPLLAHLNLMRNPVVTMLYARSENPRFPSGYRGILALTPAAEERARALAPKARVAHISWGVDLPFFPALDYNPQWFLSCGKTRRDFVTLKAAAAAYPAIIRVINTQLPSGLVWSDNVRQFTGGSNGDWLTVSFHDLIHEHYAGCAAALILLETDSSERYAAGFTQLLEAMALGRPVIVTGTGALAGELNVEKEGCGLMVPPNDPAAVIKAMRIISDDPSRAEAMGKAGRRLCETRYNIERYAADLHQFIESL
jgi:glycosyltransferase involved in cell wall biosynthesis